MGRIIPLYAELARIQQEEQRALAMQALAHVLQHTHGAEFSLEPFVALGSVLDKLGGICRQRAILTVCR